MKKQIILLSLLLFLSTVLCACGDGKKEEEDNSFADGGNVVVGITQDLDSLDRATCS